MILGKKEENLTSAESFIPRMIKKRRLVEIESSRKNKDKNKS